MSKILIGVALGQLLAVVLVAALALLVSLAFWSLVELVWRGLGRGLRSLAVPLRRLGKKGAADAR